jgi:hypothetical protein
VRDVRGGYQRRAANSTNLNLEHRFGAGLQTRAELCIVEVTSLVRDSKLVM